MKNIYLLLVIIFTFCTGAIAQVVVTVTNPTNATPNLAASYPSLALAITALDAVTSFSGPVTLTCAAGTETAPAGGYSINFTATTTAVNNVMITGTATTTITASAALTVGSLNDAIFKIIGSDYVTLQNFTMQENAANTTNTPAGSNNMTEWGVALLRSTTIDGAQHNTIQNNIISLNISYLNSFGIYSNTRHAAATPTTLSDITNVTGSNFGNKVYGNIISNVNYGVVFNGSALAAQMDDGNDIGGSSLATGNTFTNWGSAGTALSTYVDLTASNYCIFINEQINENVSYNTINGALHTTTNTMGAILKDYSSGQPGGTIISTINNNTVTVSTNASPIFIDVISSRGITPALSTATISINNNSIINCVISGAASTSILTGITNSSICGILNMNFNVFRGNTSTSTGTPFIGIDNSGAVVTTININNNQLGNASGGAISVSAATTAGVLRGIYNEAAAATATVNINNNSFDGISCVNVGALICIHNNAPSGVAVNINNNQMGTVTGNLVTFSGVQSGTLYGIFNSGGTSTCTVTIQANDVRGIVHAVTGNCAETFILQNASVLSSNILNNTFTNLSINNGGDVFFIFSSNTMASGASFTCNNNQIVTAFAKTAPGGLICFLISLGNSVSGSTMTETGNNFSNVTINGGGLVGWDEQNGISTTNGPTKTITGNVFNNITHTGSPYQTVPVILEYGTTTNFSSNTISNISSTGSIYALQFFSAIPQVGGSCTISSNTISGLNSTGGNVEAMLGGWFSASNNMVSVIIQDNIISNISSTAASAFITGIDAGGVTTTISGNVISGLSGSGTGSPSANGIIIKGGTTINVYKNKIYSILESGAISTTSPAVNGMLFIDGTTINAYNNFIADLKATNANLADAIRGISVTSATASSTYNIYYNSINLNAGSTGTNFGTSGIYHTTSATASTATLNMIDDIIVNTSTPNGTGVTAAYRRSDATLTNYSSTSDYNLFYAGTPSATRLIYYDGTNSDQTLTAYQIRVSTRDANSISVLPNFTSATDLHLTTANCWLDGKGTAVAGITTDIDNAVRNVTTPDMGADEFTAAASTTLAGVVGSAVCENRTVVGATTYISNACDLIATILPSGGAPVAGAINVCVTRQGSVQTFNSEPYVTRHYDIEPATSNTNTTSATITLYFTDGEFIAYNLANGSFPDLPTSVLGNADPNIANLRVTQYHGTASASPSLPGQYTANAGAGVLINPNDPNIVWNGSYWAVTFNISGFSGFYVHTNIYAPLPVTVNYLRGTKQGSSHLLDWKVTCNSTPSVTMTIERSALSSGGFTGINTISATAARCNQPFNYTDALPLKGMNYYRLKIVDVDGKITYSNTIALLNAVKGFDIMNIAPNPVTGTSFKLNVASAQSTKLDVVITDMTGRVVNRQTISLIAGYNSIDMNVANLAKGTYNIYGTTADDKSKVIRFVKQ